MNLLTVLGSIGGTIFLITYVVKICMMFYRFYRDYKKYESAYHDRNDEEEVKTIGFKTKKEQEEIEAKMASLKRNRA